MVPLPLSSDGRRIHLYLRQFKCDVTLENDAAFLNTSSKGEP
jgi:hypothetical protein